MLFGSIESFAVECLVDYPFLDVPKPGKTVLGRIRVWLDCEPVGDLDDYAVFVGAVVDHLEGLRFHADDAWHPLLEPLTPAERFALLDWIGFGVHLPASLEAMVPGDTAELVRAVGGCHALINVVSSFDGWKVFVLRPHGQEQVQWLWVKRSEGVIRSFEVDFSSVQACLKELREWFSGVETYWTDFVREQRQQSRGKE